MTNIWDQYVNEAANRYNVPHALVQSVLSQESGGKQNAVSSKGAGGYMQIMPDTYEELRPKHGLGPNRFDPRDNIIGGTAYMRQLYDQYGNWEDTLAAYNAGPGRLDRVKAGKSTLPTETQNYVPSVLRRAGMQGQGAGTTMQTTQPLFSLARGPGGPSNSATNAFGVSASGTNIMPGNSVTGLLTTDQDKNFYEGLGGLLGAGQTPSQPPAPRGAVEKLPTQTERLDVTTRMNDLMQQLLQPQTRAPGLTPGQYQLAGAGEAVGKLAGVHDRKVGFGEILGALGGGLTRGTAQAEQVEQERRGKQFEELTNIGKIQEYQTKQQTTAAKQQAAIRWAAQARASGDPRLIAMADAVERDYTLLDDIVKKQADQAFQKNPDPTSAHQNALAMGLRPGTPEYNQYIRDATVRSGEGSSTTATKNAIAMGLVPGTPAFNDYVQKATMPAGSVNINNAQEKSQDQAFGQELVKDYAAVRETAAASENALAQIEIAMKIPVTTGATAPWFAKAGALAESLGFDRTILAQYGLGDASNAEAFTGVMNNLVLAKMQAQKGPQTENDAKRIEATLASLGNTPDAANFLLRTAQALARRDVEKMQFYDDYRSRNNGNLDGVGTAWRSHIGNSPLVGINPKSNKPVFYSEFLSEVSKANPNASQNEIRDLWRTKYGGDAAPNPNQAGAAGRAVGAAVETLADFSRRYLDVDPMATAEQVRRAWEARGGK